MVAHLSGTDFSSKLRLLFSTSDTVDIKMKEIGRRIITSK